MKLFILVLAVTAAMATPQKRRLLRTVADAVVLGPEPSPFLLLEDQKGQDLALVQVDRGRAGESTLDDDTNTITKRNSVGRRATAAAPTGSRKRVNVPGKYDPKAYDEFGRKKSPHVTKPTKKRKRFSQNQQEQLRNFITAFIAHQDTETCTKSSEQNFCAGGSSLPADCGDFCGRHGGDCVWKWVDRTWSVFELAFNVASLAIPVVREVRLGAQAARTAATGAARAVAKQQAAKLLRKAVKRAAKETAKAVRDKLIQESMEGAMDGNVQANEYAFMKGITQVTEAFASKGVEEKYKSDADMMEIAEYVDFLGVTGVTNAFSGGSSCYLVAPPLPPATPAGAFIDETWNACLNYPFGTTFRKRWFDYGCNSFHLAKWDGQWGDNIGDIEKCHDSCDAYDKPEEVVKKASCKKGCEWFDCVTGWAQARGCRHATDPNFAGYVAGYHSDDEPIMLRTWDASGTWSSNRHLNCLSYPWDGSNSTVGFRKGCNIHVELFSAGNKLPQCEAWCRSNAMGKRGGGTDIDECVDGCRFMACNGADMVSNARGCAQQNPVYLLGPKPTIMVDPQYQKCVAYPYFSRPNIYYTKFRKGCDGYRSTPLAAEGQANGGFDLCQAECGRQNHYDMQGERTACKRGCEYMRCSIADTWAKARGCDQASPIYYDAIGPYALPLAKSAMPDFGGLDADPGTAPADPKCNNIKWFDVAGGSMTPGDPAYYDTTDPAHGKLFRWITTKCYPSGKKWQRLNWKAWYAPNGAQDDWPQANCNAGSMDRRLHGIRGQPHNLAWDMVYFRSVPCIPPVDCVGAFSNYAACSCDGVVAGASATRKRVYTISANLQGSGSVCPHQDGYVDAQDCPGQTCNPQSCVGSFVNAFNSSCSKTCGGGEQLQVYKISSPSVSGGRQCPHQDGFTKTTACNVQACPLDCEGAWDAWTVACNQTTNNQTRTYMVVKAAEHGGRECSSAHGVTQQRSCPIFEDGDVISLKGGRGKKLCTDDGERVTCGSNHALAWEMFTVKLLGSSVVALKGGRHGKWCADDDKKGQIQCNRGEIQPWERFSFLPLGGQKVALKSGRTGKWCADEPTFMWWGTGIKCDRNSIGPWETFEVSIAKKHIGSGRNPVGVRLTSGVVGDEDHVTVPTRNEFVAAVNAGAASARGLPPF